jgi:predicted DNA-binding protein with PD1-like motif
MDSTRNDDRIYARLDRGERVLEQLEALRERYGIENGFFQGIGAVDEVTLAHYDVDDQHYAESTFEEAFEVTSFSGNVGPDKIHAHITVAGPDYRARAGHCSGARVSGTFELIIWTSEAPVLTHRYDEATGLDVFDI